MPPKDPELYRAYQRIYHRRWSKAHREEIRAVRKAHYAPKKEAARQRRLANRSVILSRKLAYQKAYKLAHREQLLEKQRAWAKANPEKRVASSAHRRARKMAVLSTLTTAQWQAIIVAYKGKCAYCGVKPKKLTQDHVIPLSKNGAHTADNVVPACQSCNSRKHVGPPPRIPALRLLL